MPRCSRSTRSTAVRRLAGSTFGGSGLALDGQLVHRAGSLDDELVVRRGLGDREERVLDVRGVDVDAAHDDHVVAPAAQAADPRRRPAAAARLEGDRGDVAGAVAQQRHRLLQQGREDELALDALVERRTGLRIDDLDEEVVLVDVQAVARLEALGRDARTAHLRQPVEVDCAKPGQRALDLLAQALGPGLAAEQAELELQRGRVDPRVVHGLRDHERVRGRRDEHLRAEVVEEHRLPRREAARDRQDRGADPLRSLVEAVAAGEQPVGVRVVHEHPAAERRPASCTAPSARSTPRGLPRV